MIFLKIIGFHIGHILVGKAYFCCSNIHTSSNFRFNITLGDLSVHILISNSVFHVANVITDSAVVLFLIPSFAFRFQLMEIIPYALEKV